MNVLSLFDGMSCGQIALDNLGIKVDNYFASEIKKTRNTMYKRQFSKYEAYWRCNKSKRPRFAKNRFINWW